MDEPSEAWELFVRFRFRPALIGLDQLSLVSVLLESLTSWLASTMACVVHVIDLLTGIKVSNIGLVEGVDVGSRADH